MRHRNQVTTDIDITNIETTTNIADQEVLRFINLLNYDLYLRRNLSDGI